MGTYITVIQGDLIDKNIPPTNLPQNSIVELPGKFKGRSQGIKITENILSKHSMLIGGTGSGKTNLFYHFIAQIRNRMTNNDAMIVFDSKGDFFKRFYRQGDIVLSNSKKYNGYSTWSQFRKKSGGQNNCRHTKY